MRREMTGLRKAVEVATRVKSRKRKYNWTAKTFRASELADLVAEEEGGKQDEGRKLVLRVRTQRWTARLGWTAHF